MTTSISRGRSAAASAPATGHEGNAVPIGVAFTPFEHRAEVIETVTSHAEEHGFAFVAVAEAMSLAAPLVLAALAARTHRIGLSTGVLSVWSRTPATLALTAAQLQRQSEGRFVLGIGASTPPITEGFHGQPWERPLDRLEQTCVALRALLAGDRLPSTVNGARPLALTCPPDQPVPIALAAITPPSIELAGRVADQWLPFLLPAPALDAGRELIEGQVGERRIEGQACVNIALPVALARTESTARSIAARWLLTYATRMGPVYPRVLRNWGYRRELDALVEGNDDPRHPVLPSAATRLAEDVLLFGTHDDAGELLGRWAERADAIGLVAPFGTTAEDVVAVLDAVGGSR